MTAARAGNADAVRMLLDRGADVNARETYKGQTALMWAAAERHPAVVKLLLDARRRLEGPIVRPGNQGAPAERRLVDLADRARRIHGPVVRGA